jgi:hypothetical protein
MATDTREDGSDGGPYRQESGGIDGYRQHRLSGDAFMPVRVVGGSHVELLAPRWKRTSDRWTRAEETATNRWARNYLISKSNLNVKI